MSWQASVKSCDAKAPVLFETARTAGPVADAPASPAELCLAAKRCKPPVMLNMSFALRWADITSEACNAGLSRNVRKTADSLLSLCWRPMSRCAHSLEQYAISAAVRNATTEAGAPVLNGL